MITEHQFLREYPIDKGSEKLIVGTIHPEKKREEFLVPFFYGNTLSLWKILNEAFNNEIGTEITKEGIIRFLQNHKIAVSDTVVRCERKKPTAFDADLLPLEYNDALIDEIKHSNIKEIFFTSGFGTNNAFRLFYVNILKQQITDEIRKNRGIILDESIFGRPVTLTVLYSPSGSSNISLSKNKLYLDKKHTYTSQRPVHDFKVEYYREHFDK